jgi:fatty aldehyde-generating acyl-ACP reductase
MMWYLVAYLIGALPIGYILCRLKGVDIFEVGSGSMGSTNVGRVLGTKGQLITFILDVLKGVLAAWLGATVLGIREAVICGALAVFGHCFSIFVFAIKRKWMGGKGVATALGALSFVQPQVALPAFVLWGIVVLITNYISAGSIIAALAVIVAQPFVSSDIVVKVLAACIGVLVVVKHSGNIQKMLSGTESMARVKKLKPPLTSNQVRVGFLVHSTKTDPVAIAAEYRATVLVKLRKIPRIGSTLEGWIGGWKPRNIIRFVEHLPAAFLVGGEAHGLKTPAGNEVRVVFVGVPYDAATMRASTSKALRAINRAIMVALKLGASSVGFGAYTSIVTRNCLNVCEDFSVHSPMFGITSGNTLTAITGVEGLVAVAQKCGYRLSDCTVAVIGATGSTGKLATQLLDDTLIGRILVVGSTLEKGKDLAKDLAIEKCEAVSLEEACKTAQLIITVTSSGNLSIDPAWFMPGAIVCDIARPRDVGEAVTLARTDVLVMDGAIVKFGGGVKSSFNFGFDQGEFFACMGETILLAMDFADHRDRMPCPRTCSVGDLKLEEAYFLMELMETYEMQIAGVRSQDMPVSNERIQAHDKIVASRH